MTDIKNIIAARAAKELKDGDVVNLGIGLPTLISDFIPKEISVILQSENGIMGMGHAPKQNEEDPHITNAGSKFATVNRGASFFDSSISFGIIRGGHVDVTILGSLQVDEKGSLANWIVPQKIVHGMGGAMDLTVGVKKVIVVMTHTQNGNPKVLTKCSYPYTAIGVVNTIITEMGFMEITPAGIVLKEISPDFTPTQVQAATQAKLIIAPNLILMK